MPKKILVVDDSWVVREEVSTTLRQAGFEVTGAIDGADGLHKLEVSPDFAVVITDINMPQMTGLEMLSHIKRDGRHAGLPVVVLTTEGDPGLVRQAKAAGAKGWMVKPFKAEHLVALVRKFAGV